MAEPETSRRNGDEPSGDAKLYTLSEISQRTGISMPTLQRYKKLYQARIPAVGKGRKQRYPESALPVFDEIKNENAGRRGRPRKDAAAARPAAPAARRRGRAAAKPAGRPAAKTAAKPAAKRGPGRPPAARRGRPPAAAKATGRRGRKAAQPASKRRAAGGGNLLTLTEISEQTGISYPTLVRYVRLHSNRLPHEGKGRARRFHPEAVEVFRQLRSESGRGGRKKGTAAPAARGRGRGRAAASGGTVTGAIGQRLRSIEKSQQSLEKRFRDFAKSLARLFR
jgi:excisionase family DNA binding protein